MASGGVVEGATVGSEPAAAAVVLNRSALEDGSVAVTAWRFRIGDDASWADPEFDDREWNIVEAVLFRRGHPLPADWEGIGWLRVGILAKPDVVGESIAIRLSHRRPVDPPVAYHLSLHGAAQIFLDGQLIEAVGEVGPETSTTVRRYHQVPTSVVFDRAGEHILAVRFANYHVPAFLRTIGASGVAAVFSRPEDATRQALAESRYRNRWLGWFCGPFLTFGLLHLLMFFFYPAIRANFDFSALCFVLTGLAFLPGYRYMQPDPMFLLFSEPIMNVLGFGLGFFMLRFVYWVFYEKTPRLLRVYAVTGIPVAVWGVVQPAAAIPGIFFLILAASLEVVRVVALALVRRKPGAWLLGVGALSLVAGWSVGILDYLGDFVPGIRMDALPHLMFGVLLVTMSVYLSRSFATVHRNLEGKLVEVEQLSAEKVRQERLLREEEVERRVLKERYEQKVRELAEARELQLAMLPQRLPELPDLEVATHMETASEVGGDYYDFEMDEDGMLTIAIGDATGHGVRAGTMVTAAKGLFNALAPRHSLLETLSLSAAVIRRMNLGRLAMALGLARYCGGKLELAAAGMPPVLVYRSDSGTVEQVLLAGTPLGLMASFPYRETVLTIEPGDTVLLMSDGFPERRNSAGDLLGYERATELFAAAAKRSASALIDHLCYEAQAWADGRPADDDLTFVVLKMRTHAV